MAEFDDILEEICGNNRYQIALIALSLYAWIPDAMQLTSAVFTAGYPDTRCYIPNVDGVNVTANITDQDIKELFFPPNYLLQDYDQCKYYDYDVSSCTNASDWLNCTSTVVNSTADVETLQCEHGYVYDMPWFEETVVTEWDLVCSEDILVAVSTSIFYLGFMFGSLFGGMISDRFGRVLTFRIGCCCGLIFGLAAAFSPNIYAFTILRALQVTTFFPAIMASIVYAVEISKKEWRKASGLMANVVFGAGCMFMSLIAYLCREWKTFQIAISLFFIPAIIFTVFLPYSPRWLLAKGRVAEAKTACQKMAKRNGVRFREETWDEFVALTSKTSANKQEDDHKDDPVKEIFKLPYSRFVMITNMMIWLITSMVYYGLILNSGSLVGDIFVNVAAGGFMEFLSCLVMIPATSKIGCRRLIVLLLSVSSAACLLSTVINQLSADNDALQVVGLVLALIGRFGASGAFATLYLQTIELFPTCGRTTAVGLASMAARVGSIVSPFSVQLQRQIPWLTQVIFGIGAGFAAFVNFNFPETLGRELFVTFPESERFFERHFATSSLYQCCCSVARKRKENSANRHQDMTSSAA